MKERSGGRGKRQAADDDNSEENNAGAGRSTRTRKGRALAESDESFEGNKGEEEDEEEDEMKGDAVEEDELMASGEEDEEEDEEEEEVHQRKSSRTHAPNEALRGKSTKSPGASSATGGSPNFEWVANAKIVLEKVP